MVFFPYISILKIQSTVSAFPFAFKQWRYLIRHLRMFTHSCTQYQVSVVWWRFAFNFYIVFFLVWLCLCSRRGSLFPGCEYQLSQVIQYLEFNHFAPLFLWRCLPNFGAFKYVDIQFAERLGTADRLVIVCPSFNNRFRWLIPIDLLPYGCLLLLVVPNVSSLFSLLGLRMVLNPSGSPFVPLPVIFHWMLTDIYSQIKSWLFFSTWSKSVSALFC